MIYLETHFLGEGKDLSKNNLNTESIRPNFMRSFLITPEKSTQHMKIHYHRTSTTSFCCIFYATTANQVGRKRKDYEDIRVPKPTVLDDEQDTRVCIHLTPREQIENIFMIVYNGRLWTLRNTLKGYFGLK